MTPSSANLDKQLQHGNGVAAHVAVSLPVHEAQEPARRYTEPKSVWLVVPPGKTPP